MPGARPLRASPLGTMKATNQPGKQEGGEGPGGFAALGWQGCLWSQHRESRWTLEVLMLLQRRSEISPEEFGLAVTHRVDLGILFFQ